MLKIIFSCIHTFFSTNDNNPCTTEPPFIIPLITTQPPPSTKPPRMSFETRVNLSNGSVNHPYHSKVRKHASPIRTHPLLSTRMDHIARASASTVVSLQTTYLGNPPLSFQNHSSASPDFTGREIARHSQLPASIFYCHLPWPTTQFELEQCAIRVNLERTYDPQKIPRYVVLEMEGKVERGSFIYSQMKGFGIVGNLVRNFGYYIAIRVAFPTCHRDREGHPLFDKINILFPTINVEMSEEMRESARVWEEEHPEFVLELVKEWDSR